MICLGDIVGAYTYIWVLGRCNEIEIFAVSYLCEVLPLEQAVGDQTIRRNMLKQFILAGILACSLSLSAQKPASRLLDNRYWAAKPSLTQVKADIANGQSATESNARMMDVVTIAILSNAPSEIIGHLLSYEGNSVRKQTHHYRTYLHWAASKGAKATIQLLIDKGADINALDEHGSTPLAYAIGSGMKDISVIELFTQAGYDLKGRNKQGATLLLSAIAGDKDLKLTDYFVAQGLSLDDTDVKGANAFDYAVRAGDIRQLEALIGRGVKPTVQTLTMAARGSRQSSNGVEIYRYLIEGHKLDVSVIDGEGNNLIHLVAARPNQTEVIKYLISLGVDPALPNREGDTPLSLASSGRDLEAIKLLLPYSRVDERNSRGETPLYKAMRRSSLEIIEALLEAGADIHTTDLQGNNLVHSLAEGYREQEVDLFAAKLALLLDRGVPVALPMADGTTLYHRAVAHQSLRMLELVARLGIDINAKSSEGMTALHNAALVSRDDKMLRALVGLGADRSLRSEMMEETAYQMARDNEYLSRRGVDISFLQI